MRIQLALNVANLDQAVEFYSKLFNARVHKRRPGYANFVIDSPPLKLVLFENPQAAEFLNHLGVEVFESAQIDRARRRFTQAGILDGIERGVSCCHALQDKVWARQAQGLRWEWYRVIDDEHEGSAKVEGEVCCSGYNSDSDAE